MDPSLPPPIVFTESSFPERDSNRIRILIVDDQNFVRKMLQYSLENYEDFHIIGTAKSGEEAFSQIEQQHPDIALVDIEMPGLDGLSTTRTISERFPKTKVLVLSIHDDKIYIRDALQAGARGYLLKNTPAAELAHAIRFVSRGYLQLGPGLFEKLEQYSEIPKTHVAPSPDLCSDPPLSITIPEPVTLAATSLDLEWSAATQENINVLPRLWARGFLYLTLTFAAIILPLAVWSKVDEVGIAQGQLQPKGNTIRLDSPVQGTVAAIHVKIGQLVQKGQPIMELQSDVVNADLQQAQAKLEGLLNRQTQLLGVKTELENSLSATRQQIRMQVASQQATIDKAIKQQDSLDESLRLGQELVSKDKEKVHLLRDLANQGAIPRSQADDAERVMIQNNQLRQKTETDIEQAKAEVQKQTREYQRILQDGELNVIDKLKQIREIQSQISDTVSEAEQTKKVIESLKYQQRQRILYSSNTGTIFQLPIQFPGAVVQPGQMVAQISPSTSQLVLRAKMENRETGFLKTGLPAKLKFDAYPFQDYGIINGKISWISPTSVQGSPLSDDSSKNLLGIANENNNFELEIELSKSYVEAQGRKIPLKAGQSATAEIIIRQRRVLDLFLDPFQKLSRDGLKL